MSTVKTEASCSPLAVQAEGFARWMDHLFTLVAKSADDQARVWLAGFTGIYVAFTVLGSLAKPMWLDELYTFYVSRVPGWKERLPLGADIPPAFYGLTNACIRLFGGNSFAVRLPETLGFLLMCVCVFVFVRRRCRAIYAFLAMFLLAGSMAYPYAYEARPYGIILGLAGLSLYSWQSIGEGRRRKLSLLFLMLSVAIAVNIHYFGAQIAVPLLAGEAVRSVKRSKVDWGVIFAVALGLSPLSVILPLALRESSTPRPPTFWSPANLASFFHFYDHLFEPMLFCVVAGMAATALVYLLSGPEPDSAGPTGAEFLLHELAACAAYLLLPAMAVLACRLSTGIWYDRYGLTAVLGCVILFVYLCSCLCRQRFVMPCLLIASLFCMWAFRAVGSGVRRSGQGSDLRTSSPIYPKADALPIVVADKHWFLPMAHYSAPQVVSRLVYLTDVANAARSPDLYKDDRSLFLWRNILPGTVEDYQVFLSRNREFWLLYRNQGGLEWVPSQLKEDGWNLEYQSQDSDQILFRVTR